MTYGYANKMNMMPCAQAILKKLAVLLVFNLCLPDDNHMSDEILDLFEWGILIFLSP